MAAGSEPARTSPQREGKYPPPPDASPHHGVWKIAGEVVALGDGATLALGAKICAGWRMAAATPNIASCRQTQCAALAGRL